MFGQLLAFSLSPFFGHLGRFQTVLRGKVMDTSAEVFRECFHRVFAGTQVGPHGVFMLSGSHTLVMNRRISSEYQGHQAKTGVILMEMGEVGFIYSMKSLFISHGQLYQLWKQCYH